MRLNAEFDKSYAAAVLGKRLSRREVLKGVAIGGALLLPGAFLAYKAASFLKPEPSFKKEEPTIVALDELLTNPEKYVGKTVHTAGYYQEVTPALVSEPFQNGRQILQEVYWINELYQNQEQTGRYLNIREHLDLLENNPRIPGYQAQADLTKHFGIGEIKRIGITGQFFNEDLSGTSPLYILEVSRNQ